VSDKSTGGKPQRRMKIDISVNTTVSMSRARNVRKPVGHVLQKTKSSVREIKSLVRDIKIPISSTALHRRLGIGSSHPNALEFLTRKNHPLFRLHPTQVPDQARPRVLMIKMESFHNLLAI